MPHAAPRSDVGEHAGGASGVRYHARPAYELAPAHADTEETAHAQGNNFKFFLYNKPVM